MTWGIITREARVGQQQPDPKAVVNKATFVVSKLALGRVSDACLRRHVTLDLLIRHTGHNYGTASLPVLIED